MPASSGTIRHIVGAGDFTRRLTPNGEIRTRWSDINAGDSRRRWHADQDHDIAGRVGVTWSAKYRALVIAVPARAGCSSLKIPMPSRAPSRALTTASTEEMTLTWSDRGADQPERCVALLSPGGREAGGGTDQDEDREQERDARRRRTRRGSSSTRPAAPARWRSCRRRSWPAGRPASPGRSRRRSPAPSGRSAPAARSFRRACRGTGPPSSSAGTVRISAARAGEA